MNDAAITGCCFVMIVCACLFVADNSVIVTLIGCTRNLLLPAVVAVVTKDRMA